MHTPQSPCSGPDPGPLTRRDALFRAGGGLGGLALAWLSAREAEAAGAGAVGTRPAATDNVGSVRHHAPRVTRVIQIFAAGGVSHVDTFDYKPELARLNGQPLSGKGKVDTFFAQPGNLMASPFTFRQHGKSGLWISDLLPALSGCADLLTVVRSMVAANNNHTPASFMMNTGFALNGFPCMGSWVSYGLGSENENLPAFVVLPDPRQLPAGGSINWTAGFLPAAHQGVAFRTRGEPIQDLTPANPTSPALESASRGLLGEMNRGYAEASGGEGALTARIRSYELAARMQLSVPDAVRVEEESAATRRLYSLDDPQAGAFGKNCLLARRLVERGVRFVQLYHGGAFAAPRINWDGHEDVKQNHETQAASLDRPVAGLLRDLQQRGLLDETLVLWTTEFGRTPFTQGLGSRGRDHHQHVFSCWMAGGGLKAGLAYGESDEVGYKAARDPVAIPDLHATALHLMGVDHQRLTYYHNGIQRRLTNVEGEVIHGILA